MENPWELQVRAHVGKVHWGYLIIRMLSGGKTEGEIEFDGEFNIGNERI